MFHDNVREIIDDKINTMMLINQVVMIYVILRTVGSMCRIFYQAYGSEELFIVSSNFSGFG